MVQAIPELSSLFCYLSKFTLWGYVVIRFTCIMCTKKLSSMQHGVRVPKCKTNVIFKGGPELRQAQPCWGEGLIELGLS